VIGLEESVGRTLDFFLRDYLERQEGRKRGGAAAQRSEETAELLDTEDIEAGRRR